jgi:hypothetical protein
LPPALKATPRPEEPTAESVGLPAVLKAASIKEILKARKLVPDNQDIVEQDKMVGPEHVVLTGHIDMADFSQSKDDIANGRALFEYRNFRSVRVCSASSCAANGNVMHAFYTFVYGPRAIPSAEDINDCCASRV